MTTTPKPRRRWFQFRLRTLLVLMLLACIGMGWPTMMWRQAKKQREAVSAILQSHGKIEQWKERFALLSKDSPSLSTQGTFESTGYVQRLRFPNESRVHAWLRGTLGDDFFAYPICVSDVNDAAMEHLDRLPHLESLIVSSAITDAGLSHLHRLPQLKSLSMWGRRWSDAGMSHLRCVPELNTLYLYSPLITDAGLVHLKGLTRLERVRLSNTQVTTSGAAKLGQALPNCQIDL
jgi:hypothetical protein